MRPCKRESVPKLVKTDCPTVRSAIRNRPTWKLSPLLVGSELLPHETKISATAQIRANRRNLRLRMDRPPRDEVASNVDSSGGWWSREVARHDGPICPNYSSASFLP